MNGIWKQLEDVFGDAIKDRSVRAYLTKTKAIEALENGVKDLAEVQTDLADFCSLAGKDYLRLPDRKAQTLLDERRKANETAEALSNLYASAADQDEEVAAFRKDLLSGKLLHRDDMERWINNHEEGSTLYAEMVLGQGSPRPRFDKKSASFQIKPPISGPVVRLNTKVLEYPGADMWVRVVPTKAGSDLDRLRRLSESLSGSYPWQKAQATAFVLTGLAPYVSGIRASFDPNTARFTIDVHLFTTPRLLADCFRRAKKELLQSRRTKQLRPKHMRLAMYADSTDWKKTMALWNKENKKDSQYKNAALFRRDAQKARERLLVTRSLFSKESGV